LGRDLLKPKNINGRAAIHILCRNHVYNSKACEWSVSEAENGAERAENRLEWSGELSRVQKIKWSADIPNVWQSCLEG